MSPAQSGEASGLPSRVGNYRIEDRLGSGGMGVVYRAWDEALRRPLAVKRLPPGTSDDTARRRFRREAQAAARLNHPAIVHIYEIVESEEGDWIVMELVEGDTLSGLLAAGEIGVLEALRLAREIAEGLAEAHAQGVIHRDLKTNNVMVTKTGRAKILDFGIAKLPAGQYEDTELSQTGMIIGTYHAMSPEQAMGLALDPRSDLFSLGSLLYEMLTGTSPFRGGNATETLARICSYHQPPARRLRREVPQEVSDLIDRLLAKDPRQRPASATEVSEALEAAVDRMRSGSISPSAPSAPSSSAILRPSDATGVATLVERPPASPSVSSSRSRRTIRERRQVTLAFCELTGVKLSGGQAVPTALDLEDVHEVLPEVREAAARVAERFGGTVGDSMGHRLALYFGYPQAHEDAAQRGVRAALELAARVERLSARYTSGGELRMALRAAVHTGTAIVLPEPEQLTLGVTLDVAAGILARAAPGEVLVSTATQRLLREAFPTEALPPIEIQGTGELTAIHRVLEAGPLTETREPPTPLVGRERELELLLDLWRKAAQGTGQVVLLSGEPGMGKSHLVRGFRERVSGRESPEPQWLFCHGSPYASSSPLQPVVDLLQRTLEGGPRLDRLEELLRRHDLPLAERVPLFASLLGIPLEGRYPSPELPPDRLRERTLEAIAELAFAMADRQPLVWVFEDLHWLDPSTMRLLDLLLEQAVSAPIFLVITVRPDTMEAVWGPRAHLTQLNLAPMSESEAVNLINRLIDKVAGRPLPEDVRRQIVARTDGVPLFVEELTRNILETGEGDPSEIPTTLRDSLAARLDRMGAAKEVAQLASVLGRSFTFELLAAVSSLDEAALQGELKRLVQAELLHRRGFGSRTHYLFKHALIRDAAYDSLLRKERQQVHIQVAQALENIEETRPEILAYHYTEGNLPEKAVGRWLEAARQALGRSALLEALSHVRSGLGALAGLPPGPARDEWELQLQTTLAPAIIATQGFSSPEVERAYLRGLELCGEEGSQRFELLYGLFSFYAVQARPDRALPLGEQMLRIAEHRGSAPYLVQSRYGLGAMSFLLGDFEASRRHLAAAFSQDDPELGRLLPLSFGTDDRKTSKVYDSLNLWQLGFPDQALEQNRAALAWIRETPQPFTLTTGLLLSGFLHCFLRDDAEVRRHAEEMLALAEEHGLFQVRDANVLLGLALNDVEHLKRSLEAYRATGFRVFLSFYLAELAAACLRQGRLEESRAALDEALAEGSERFWEPELYRLDGELHAAAGNPKEAEAAFRKALITAAGRSATSLELRAAVSLARLWQGQGRRDEARQILSGVYATFAEGLATADVVEAGTLLAALA